MFLSKFWNEIDKKLELCRVNCFFSCLNERKKFIILLVRSVYYDAMIVIVYIRSYRIYAGSQVVFVLTKSNTTLCLCPRLHVSYHVNSC